MGNRDCLSVKFYKPIHGLNQLSKHFNKTTQKVQIWSNSLIANNKTRTLLRVRIISRVLNARNQPQTYRQYHFNNNDTEQRRNRDTIWRKGQ